MLTEAQIGALKRFRSYLQCPVCKGIFSDPCSLSCRHSFCRSCIYAELTKKVQQCPTCKLPACPKEVHKNPTLDSIIAGFKDLRRHLENELDSGRLSLGTPSQSEEAQASSLGTRHSSLSTTSGSCADENKQCADDRLTSSPAPVSPASSSRTAALVEFEEDEASGAFLSQACELSDIRLEEQTAGNTVPSSTDFSTSSPGRILDFGLSQNGSNNRTTGKIKCPKINGGGGSLVVEKELVVLSSQDSDGEEGEGEGEGEGSKSLRWVERQRGNAHAAEDFAGPPTQRSTSPTQRTTPLPPAALLGGEERQQRRGGHRRGAAAPPSPRLRSSCPAEEEEVIPLQQCSIGANVAAPTPDSRGSGYRPLATEEGTRGEEERDISPTQVTTPCPEIVAPPPAAAPPSSVPGSSYGSNDQERCRSTQDNFSDAPPMSSNHSQENLSPLPKRKEGWVSKSSGLNSSWMSKKSPGTKKRKKDSLKRSSGGGGASEQRISEVFVASSQKGSQQQCPEIINDPLAKVSGSKKRPRNETSHGFLSSHQSSQPSQPSLKAGGEGTSPSHFALVVSHLDQDKKRPAGPDLEKKHNEQNFPKDPAVLEEQNGRSRGNTEYFEAGVDSSDDEDDPWAEAPTVQESEKPSSLNRGLLATGTDAAAMSIPSPTNNPLAVAADSHTTSQEWEGEAVSVGPRPRLPPARVLSGSQPWEEAEATPFLHEQQSSAAVESQALLAGQADSPPQDAAALSQALLPPAEEDEGEEGTLPHSSSQTQSPSLRPLPPPAAASAKALPEVASSAREKGAQEVAGRGNRERNAPATAGGAAHNDPRRDGPPSSEATESPPRGGSGGGSGSGGGGGGGAPLPPLLPEGNGDSDAAAADDADGGESEVEESEGAHLLPPSQAAAVLGGPPPPPLPAAAAASSWTGGGTQLDLSQSQDENVEEGEDGSIVEETCEAYVLDSAHLVPSRTLNLRSQPPSSFNSNTKDSSGCQEDASTEKTTRDAAPTKATEKKSLPGQICLAEDQGQSGAQLDNHNCGLQEQQRAERTSSWGTENNHCDEETAIPSLNYEGTAVPGPPFPGSVPLLGGSVAEEEQDSIRSANHSSSSANTRLLSRNPTLSLDTQALEAGLAATRDQAARLARLRGAAAATAAAGGEAAAAAKC